MCKPIYSERNENPVICPARPAEAPSKSKGGSPRNSAANKRASQQISMYVMGFYFLFRFFFPATHISRIASAANFATVSCASIASTITNRDGSAFAYER